MKLKNPSVAANATPYLSSFAQLTSLPHDTRAVF